MSDFDKNPIPYLSDSTIHSVLEMDELIRTMADALVAYSAGNTAQADRQMLPVPAGPGFFGAMSAAGDAVGVKLVNFFPENARHKLPTHLAVILLFNPQTGEPLVMMDGRLITEMRTSATSAAVVNHVAPAKPSVLTVMGTGLQAKTHVDAMRQIRAFDEVRIWGRTAEKAQTLADAVGAVAIASAQEAVRDADVVVTATASMTPIVHGEWLKPGAVVSAVGWNSKEAHELDAAAMNNTVLVESLSGTSKESGNVRVHQAKIFAEAGQVLSGDKTVPLGQTVVFDSIGMAAEDVATARLVWDKVSGG